jgi:hypothetical protein
MVVERIEKEIIVGKILNVVPDIAAALKIFFLNYGKRTDFWHLVLKIIFFIIYVFGAGPSSAHMGWARPNQPSPVTGPS